MKIIIKAEGRNLKIRIPSALLFNRLTAEVGAKVIEKYVPKETLQLESSDVVLLVKEVNRVRRFHKDMPLVDVESSNGERVIIYL